MEVPVAVKRDTRFCEHDFSCLVTGHCGSKEVCDVEFPIGRSMLFLLAAEPATCPYRVSYGARQACTCPVHCYLHKEGLLAEKTAD
ncbi:MAG: hypothetical protein WCL44_13185 [bacterium]